MALIFITLGFLSIQDKTDPKVLYTGPDRGKAVEALEDFRPAKGKPAHAYKEMHVLGTPHRRKFNPANPDTGIVSPPPPPAPEDQPQADAQPPSGLEPQADLLPDPAGG